jgi:hypothetical protein
MSIIVPESDELIRIIQEHKWTLYRGNVLDEAPPTWEMIEANGPVAHCTLGQNYVVAPMAAEGKSVRATYNFCGKGRPSLTVRDPNHDRWRTLMVQPWRVGRPMRFSRLAFLPECAIAYWVGDPNEETIGVSYNHLLDTFRNYFSIAPIENHPPMN